MTLRSSYGELVPILVVASAFFLFFCFASYLFLFFLHFSYSPENAMLHNWAKAFVQNRLFLFHIYPWRFHENFFFIFNDVEAMIERLENISCFIKALAYCELLIKFRYSEKATKDWPIYHF